MLKVLCFAQILYNKLGMENKQVAFLFTDLHVAEEGMYSKPLTQMLYQVFGLLPLQEVFFQENSIKLKLSVLDKGVVWR